MKTEQSKPLAPIGYPFSEEDARRAFEEWGCNCGPTALAFALQTTLDKVRPLFPDFESRRYVSPTMMKWALETAGISFQAVRKCSRSSGSATDQRPTAPWLSSDLICDIGPATRGRFSLVRIQFTGPWTAPGSNPRWAYRHTHWITSWSERRVELVFDCNGGVRSLNSWETEIVPLLTSNIQRADDGWFPTHIWRLER